MATHPRTARLICRPMLDGDLGDVLGIETRAYAFPWTRGVFRDCLKASNESVVAHAVGTLVGYAVLALGAGEAHLLNVCISRDYQGFGYGRELMLFMLRRAVVRGAEVVFLEVRPSNRIAAALYESLGFREIGIRKDYYPAHIGHEDARVLALKLDNAPLQ